MKTEIEIEEVIYSGTALSNWRKSRGYKQLELSKAAGISRRALQNYEVEKTYPTEDILAHLGYILNVQFKVPPRVRKPKMTKKAT